MKTSLDPKVKLNSNRNKFEDMKYFTQKYMDCSFQVFLEGMH